MIGRIEQMKKTFILPSLEVKEFDRVSILTVSGDTPDTPEVTNLQKAEEALQGIATARITL